MEWKIEQLSKEEIRFARAVASDARNLMRHPFFVLSPWEIIDQEQDLIARAAKNALDDVDFVKGEEKNGIPYQRLRFIVYSVAGFELWKHGMMLYIQWVLQVVAIGILWGILWLL